MILFLETKFLDFKLILILVNNKYDYIQHCSLYSVSYLNGLNLLRLHPQKLIEYAVMYSCLSYYSLTIRQQLSQKLCEILYSWQSVINSGKLL